MSNLIGTVERPNISATPPPDKFSTDVDGVFADDHVQAGTDKHPVFNVTKDEFFSNLTADRKRMRFKSGSTPQKYMSSTKYNRPFFVQYTDEKSGKMYRRKVK